MSIRDLVSAVITMKWHIRLSLPVHENIRITDLLFDVSTAGATLSDPM